MVAPPNILLSTAMLRARGMGRGAVERAIADGSLWRVHRGWYAEPGADAELIRAMRLGGRLGCVSALRLHGAWMPPDGGLHLAMPTSASGRRLARAPEGSRVTVHWSSTVVEQRAAAGMSGMNAAIGHCIVCQPADYAVAVLDSLLHRRITSEARLKSIRERMPETARPVFDAVDGRSEDGAESIARCRLARLGIVAVPQVEVPGVGRPDLLIDDWLVIELDGRTTHAQADAFDRDRRRIARLQQRGYTVLSFTYAQVIYDWAHVEATVLAVLAHH